MRYLFVIQADLTLQSSLEGFTVLQQRGLIEGLWLGQFSEGDSIIRGEIVGDSGAVKVGLDHHAIVYKWLSGHPSLIQLLACIEPSLHQRGQAEGIPQGIYWWGQGVREVGQMIFVGCLYPPT